MAHFPVRHPCGAHCVRPKRHSCRFVEPSVGFASLLRASSRHKKSPIQSGFLIWRRGRDSNPRYGVTVHTLSRRAPSTARTPLLIVRRKRRFSSRLPPKSAKGYNSWRRKATSIRNGAHGYTHDRAYTARRLRASTLQGPAPRAANTSIPPAIARFFIKLIVWAWSLKSIWKK
jgi:hypothetical protein